MASSRRTDIRRGGIDLDTIVTNPDTMINDDGKLELPSLGETGDIKALQHLSAALDIPGDAGRGQATNEVLTFLLQNLMIIDGANDLKSIVPRDPDASIALGTSANKFAKSFFKDESVYIGNKKLSVDSNSGHLTVSNVDTQGVETLEASLSADSLRQDIQASLLANPTDPNSFVAQIATEVNTGAQGPAGPTGIDGKSIYQVWIDLGNTGTETDFLNTLKGADGAIGQDGAVGSQGPAGQDGAQGIAGSSTYQIWLNEPNTGTEADFLNSLKGADGDDGLSAYQAWLALGNGGTEQQFIDSLKGLQGDIGPQGSVGSNGADANNNTIATTLASNTSFQDAVADSSVKTLGDNIIGQDVVFSTWTSTTSLSTAINGFNQVLNNLTPKKAPGLSVGVETLSVSSLSIGSAGYLSGVASYEAVTSDTHTQNVFQAVVKDGSYAILTDDGHRRIGILDGSTNVTGELNSTVSSEGNSYAAKAFGDAKTGTLKLVLNGTNVVTVDLSTAAAITTTTGTRINLSDVSFAQYDNGADFDIFKYRTGSYTVDSGDSNLRDGWNWLKLVHDLDGSTIRETEIVEWYRDTNADAIAGTNSQLINNLSGTAYLSGVKYFNTGTLQYKVDLDNVYKNTYPSSVTIFNNNSTVDNTTVPITALGNDTEAKQIQVDDNSISFNNNVQVSQENISFNARIYHPSKGQVDVGTQSISNILFNNKSATATVLKEYFDDESMRLPSGITYSDQASLSATFTSASPLAADELLIYGEHLKYPSIDFRNITDGGAYNGPSSNVDYSSSTGERTYYRKFQNTSGSTKKTFRVKISGSGTIVPNDDPLINNNSNLRVYFKLPETTSLNQTGWVDIAKPFTATSSSPYTAIVGGYTGSLDDSLNNNWKNVSFGTTGLLDNEYILIKITAPQGWAGDVTLIEIDWS
jgi:hypothetical protein